jgi:hypothetical protein
MDSVYDIKARIFNNAGPLSTEILVNSTIQHSQTNPDVAINEQGEFIVVWDSWFQDGGDRGIYAQRFGASGHKNGAEFQINLTTAYSQTRPAVKYLPDNRNVVTWESWNQDEDEPSGYGIYARLIHADGSMPGGEIQVNTYVNNYQWYSDIEVFNDTSFVVLWCSWEQDGDDGGIYLQRFDKSGNKIGNETRVNLNTAYYQWLPRIIRLEHKNFAVVWSSWKQDGSREGIYARFFDEENGRISFEMEVNNFTANYQWEPDAIAINGDDILVVWASWGIMDKDYEIMAGHITPIYPQGILNPISYAHSDGRSTSGFIVHVTDSTALTGDVYEISFVTISSDSAYVNIQNTSTAEMVIEDFLIFNKEDYLFLTQVFEGVRVEIMPEFGFEIDMVNSKFINISGTNLDFIYQASSIGLPKMVPIDVMLIWSNTDTLPNGRYTTPLDTAMGIDGIIDIEVPFICWNITDDEQMDLFVVEEDVIVNERWDAQERIELFTPVQYRDISTNMHLEILTIAPGEALLLPAQRDTNFIFTTRPISNQDVFTFQTLTDYISGIESSNDIVIQDFRLNQNYPNPFNPSTRISFFIPSRERVTLMIYNILGQHIRTLIDGFIDRGMHHIQFDGTSYASGTYIYVLKYADLIQSKKMLLLK